MATFYPSASINALYIIVLSCCPYTVMNTVLNQLKEWKEKERLLCPLTTASIPFLKLACERVHVFVCPSVHARVPVKAQIQSVLLINSRCVASQIRKRWFSESVPALWCLSNPFGGQKKAKEKPFIYWDMPGLDNEEKGSNALVKCKGELFLGLYDRKLEVDGLLETSLVKSTCRRHFVKSHFGLMGFSAYLWH